MNDHPSHTVQAPSVLPDDPGLTGEDPEGLLQRRFGARWKITLESSLGVWSALRRSPDGRSIRVIIGPSAGELLAKLETAETVEP